MRCESNVSRSASVTWRNCISTYDKRILNFGHLTLAVYFNCSHPDLCQGIRRPWAATLSIQIPVQLVASLRLKGRYIGITDFDVYWRWHFCASRPVTVTSELAMCPHSDFSWVRCHRGFGYVQFLVSHGTQILGFQRALRWYGWIRNFVTCTNAKLCSERSGELSGRLVY